MIRKEEKEIAACPILNKERMREGKGKKGDEQENKRTSRTREREESGEKRVGGGTRERERPTLFEQICNVVHSQQGARSQSIEHTPSIKRRKKIEWSFMHS